jgi:hypothetical protein
MTIWHRSQECSYLLSQFRLFSDLESVVQRILTSDIYQDERGDERVRITLRLTLGGHLNHI